MQFSMRQILTLILIIFHEMVLNLAWAQDNEPIAFARIRIEGVQVPEEPALPYNRLMTFLLKNLEDVEITNAYYPTARGFLLFEHGKVDCVFPGDTNSLNPPFDIIVSEHFNMADAYLFNLAKEPLNEHNIKGKKLALLRGYVYGGNYTILTHNQVVTVNNSTSAMSMLQLGRIDAFADYYLDLKRNLPPVMFEQLNYDKATPITSVKDRLICQSSDKTQKLINEINLLIVKMKQDGSLKQLLGNYYGYVDNN
ncbi:transporter substrate-binding domain-containing protein [Colwelliaceae bacterium 6471]